MKRWLKRLVMVLLVPLLLFVGLWIAGPEALRMEASVQNVLADSAEICCYLEHAPALQVELRQGAERRLLYGPAPPRPQLRLRVDGLEPARTYGYRILRQADGVEVFAGKFRTPPRPGQGQVRIALVGDSGDVPNWFKLQRQGVGRLRGLVRHLETTGQWGVAAAMARQQPDLFFHLGDIIYTHNQLPGYQEAFFLPFAPVLSQAALYTVHGNHDMHRWEHPEYFRLFPRREPLDPARGYRDSSYAFDWGPLRCIVLDAFWADWQTDSAERAWLDVELARSTSQQRLVLIHNPPFSDEEGVTENTKVQERIWPLLVAAKVDLVVCGDSHSYQRFRPIEGLPLVIVGTGGKSIRPVAARRLEHAEERFGFLLLEADAEGMRGRFFGVDTTQALDSFSVPRRR